jgi:hypothetical protein
MSIKEEQAVLAFADGDDVPLDEAGIDAGAISSVPSIQLYPGKVHWPLTPLSKTTQRENPSDMSPQANGDIMKLLSDMLAYQRSAEHGGEIDPAEMASILVAIQRGVQQGSEDNEVDEDVDASYFDDDNETADDDDDYDANEEWDETHVETEDDGGTNSGSESADEPSSHVMKEDPDAPKPELIELFKTSGSDDSEHGRVEHPWISSELDDEARPITSADKKGEGDFHDIESGQDPEAEKWNDAYDRAPTSRGFRRYEIVGLAVCGVVLFLVIVLSIVLTRSDVVTPTTPSSMVRAGMSTTVNWATSEFLHVSHFLFCCLAFFHSFSYFVSAIYVHILPSSCGAITTVINSSTDRRAIQHITYSTRRPLVASRWSFCRTN